MSKILTLGVLTAISLPVVALANPSPNFGPNRTIYDDSTTLLDRKQYFINFMSHESNIRYNYNIEIGTVSEVLNQDKTIWDDLPYLIPSPGFGSNYYQVISDSEYRLSIKNVIIENTDLFVINHQSILYGELFNAYIDPDYKHIWTERFGYMFDQKYGSKTYSDGTDSYQRIADLMIFLRASLPNENEDSDIINILSVFITQEDIFDNLPPFISTPGNPLNSYDDEIIIDKSSKEYQEYETHFKQLIPTYQSLFLKNRSLELYDLLFNLYIVKEYASDELNDLLQKDYDLDSEQSQTIVDQLSMGGKDVNWRDFTPNIGSDYSEQIKDLLNLEDGKYSNLLSTGSYESTSQYAVIAAAILGAQLDDQLQLIDDMKKRLISEGYDPSAFDGIEDLLNTNRNDLDSAIRNKEFSSILNGDWTDVDLESTSEIREKLNEIINNENIDVENIHIDDIKDIVNNKEAVVDIITDAVGAIDTTRKITLYILSGVFGLMSLMVGLILLRIKNKGYSNGVKTIIISMVIVFALIGGTIPIISTM